MSLIFFLKLNISDRDKILFSMIFKCLFSDWKETLKLPILGILMGKMRLGIQKCSNTLRTAYSRLSNEFILSHIFIWTEEDSATPVGLIVQQVIAVLLVIAAVCCLIYWGKYWKESWFLLILPNILTYSFVHSWIIILTKLWFKFFHDLMRDKPSSACGWSDVFSQGSPIFASPTDWLSSKWVKQSWRANSPQQNKFDLNFNLNTQLKHINKQLSLLLWSKNWKKDFNTWFHNKKFIAETETSYEPRHDKVRPVWSESLLSAWRKLGSLATHWARSEDSDQTGRMPRLIWVFAGRTLILLVLSRHGSYWVD